MKKGKEAKQFSGKYSKEQILASCRYQECRDLLEALLTEDRTYTLAETEEMVTAYQKGRVK